MSIQIKRDGRVLTVLVDAPPHNYLDRPLVEALHGVLRQVERDPGIGAVVVGSAVPGRYLTHWDIADLLHGAETSPRLPMPVARAVLGAVRGLTGLGAGRLLARSPLAGVYAMARFQELALRLLRSPAIWIAAIDGPCGGGGLELSVFFDVRVASARSSFLVPELTIGLTTTLGSQRLTHLLGPARALRLLLDAEPCTAAEALDAGLIDRVRPADPMAEAQRLAHRYARRPRAHVGRQKQLINRAYERTALQTLNGEGVSQLVGVPTPGTRAAMRRWLELRRPDGESTFLTDMRPWADGTALDLNSPPPER
ncbi:enoyl-CoA hydratase/isomerase family protein [Catenuloplanes atrovinosus]|uniref:Enoyl-CoA hydratase/carnithine racemase n=1 Tax=Catenuloplanes atrovinosus TaxID=137266 RepID=A0AAE4CB58_9ACTN|nr:enoyl-CoA hydratase/isomerase family protein [Catenuloplanes atrovinosus]MDR7276494.1 enoyl-CoA hydratase/carnithine racemase [Catenuloplanes atrovinosus]